MRTKEEILAKRIVKFPEEDFYEQGYGTMTDESIKRNVYAAMDEYARQQAIAFNQYIIGKLQVYESTRVGQENGKYIMLVSANPDKQYSQFIEHQQSTDNKKRTL